MSLLNGLVSYYKLDLDTNDILNRYNCTNYGAILVPGKINNGYSFNGSSNYITAGIGVMEFDNGNYDFSISCWIKLNNVSGNKGIVSRWGADASKQSWVIRMSGSLVRFAYYTGSAYIIADSSALTIDTWYHITAVKSGGYVYVYINGVLSKSVSGTGIINNTAQDFRIGGGQQSDYFNGLIDEVSVWNRALSSTEVSQLYNSGYGITYHIKKINNINLSNMSKLYGINKNSIYKIMNIKIIG